MSNQEKPDKAFNLPLVAPDCPCTLDVYTSPHFRVWVSGGSPETEAERAARQKSEGEDYFPRFCIQIEVPSSQYYDCWDASDDWSDVLAWVPQGHSIGEETARKLREGL